MQSPDSQDGVTDWTYLADHRQQRLSSASDVPCQLFPRQNLHQSANTACAVTWYSVPAVSCGQCQSSTPCKACPVWRSIDRTPALLEHRAAGCSNSLQSTPVSTDSPQIQPSSFGSLRRALNPLGYGTYRNIPPSPHGADGVWDFPVIGNPRHYPYCQYYQQQQVPAVSHVVGAPRCRDVIHVTPSLPVDLGATAHAWWLPDRCNYPYRQTYMYTDNATLPVPVEAFYKASDQYGDFWPNENAKRLQHEQNDVASTKIYNTMEPTSTLQWTTEPASLAADVRVHPSSPSDVTCRHHQQPGGAGTRPQRGASSRRQSSVVRRFVCASCLAAFIDRASLVRHSRVHTGHRPYGCPVCSRTFTQSGNLTRHIRAKHSTPVVNGNADKQQQQQWS